MHANCSSSSQPNEQFEKKKTVLRPPILSKSSAVLWLGWRRTAHQFERNFKTHMYLANILLPIFPHQDVKLEVLWLWEAETHTKLSSKEQHICLKKKIWLSLVSAHTFECIRHARNRIRNGKIFFFFLIKKSSPLITMLMLCTNAFFFDFFYLFFFHLFFCSGDW